ncbi:MAG: DUF2330 domain-containing protein [Candidatus Methylacidiphilales bacterium]
MGIRLAGSLFLNPGGAGAWVAIFRLVACTALMLATQCQPAHAVAVVGRNGEGPVLPAREQAVIIWDKATGTQHLVYQVTIASSPINGTAPLLSRAGYLVPTPTMPQVGEADPEILRLAGQMARTRVYGPVVAFTPFFTMVYVVALGLSGMALFYGMLWVTRLSGWRAILCVLAIGLVLASVALYYALCWVSVESPGVAAIVRGAGLPEGERIDAAFGQSESQVVTLQASDTAGIQRWFTSHDFAPPANLQAWLAPYAQQGWVITAVALQAPTQAACSIRSETLCLSFSTTWPSFPYSVPANPWYARSSPGQGIARPDNWDGVCEVRLAVISSDRMATEHADRKGAIYRGDVRYAGSSFESADMDDVSGYAPGTVTSQTWAQLAGLTSDSIATRFPGHLTCFVDFMRYESGDLFFFTSRDQSVIRNECVVNGAKPRYTYGVDDDLYNGVAAALLIADAFIAWLLLRGIVLLIRSGRSMQLGIHRSSAPNNSANWSEPAVQH